MIKSVRCSRTGMILSCLLALFLLVAGPMNYFNLRNVQLDGGVLESAYYTPGGRRSDPKLVLRIAGERYRIDEECLEDDLQKLEPILQRRTGEWFHFRYVKDLFGRRTIVELEYLGLELVNYDYAMAENEAALKEGAWVSAVAGLLYFLLILFLRYAPDKWVRFE